MDEYPEGCNPHWRDLAHSLAVILRNHEQNSHNMFRAYVVAFAWRLYRAMCKQRPGEAFPYPPLELGEIAKWLQTLG